MSLVVQKVFSAKKMVAMVDILWTNIYAFGCQMVKNLQYLVFHRVRISNLQIAIDGSIFFFFFVDNFKQFFCEICKSKLSFC